MCDGAPTKNVNPPTSMYQERARSVARPKRWFHMNQDINQDPEFEYFCKKCGLAGVRFFIEAMAILDKTDNHWCLHKNWNMNTLARRCGTQSKQILNSYQTMLELSWIKVATDSEQSMYIYAPNFLKYRGNRVHEHAMTITQSSTPPSLPFPNLTKPKKERPPISPKAGDEVEPITVEEVRSLVDEIPGVKPTKALTGGCLRSVKTRIAEHPDKTFWVGYCAEIRDSDFLCGRKNDFQASLAWLCLPNNMSKVLSGFYASRTGPTAMPPKKGFISKGDKAMDSGMRVLAKLKEQEAIHGTIGNREASNLIG